MHRRDKFRSVTMVIWCPEPGSNELFLPKRLHGKNVSSVSRLRPETLFPAGNIRKFRLRNIGKHWETFSYWKHSSSAPWTTLGRPQTRDDPGRPRSDGADNLDDLDDPGWSPAVCGCTFAKKWMGINTRRDPHGSLVTTPLSIYIYPHATISNRAHN